MGGYEQSLTRTCAPETSGYESPCGVMRSTPDAVRWSRLRVTNPHAGL